MKNEKFILSALTVFFLLFIFTKPLFAQSSYVLPYPSFMPGSKFYVLHRIWEESIKYWYFGEFGQFVYNLKQSDKYLIEAKTLFEYDQYLLAYQALQKSDTYFLKINPELEKAKLKGKNISQKELVLALAARKHIEVFTAVGKQIPEEFLWQPEKVSSIKLNLAEAIKRGIMIREKAL